jgi:TolB-like protein
VTHEPQDGEETTFWERLRRRKVVQWGVAYAAGVWGFLQGLEYVSDTFGWPGRLQQLATLALAIGLPVVLVLAWYHGDRGQQRVSRAELAIITLLFLVGGGIFWRYDRASEEIQATRTPVAAPASQVTTVDAGPSIAVLPFDNRSAKADDAFFVDGIHDDILTQLSKVSALKVISRTSVEQFRDTKLPVKDIAALLGVNSILEGGVQRGGDRVRVTVQLIDAATDAHLWAETFDRELTAENVFAIQSEVAAAIAGALRAELTAGEKARVDAVPTQSIEAWESYQLGKQRMARRSSDALAEAEEFFRKAIELDPQFALAHVGLADVLNMQIDYSGAAPAAASPRQTSRWPRHSGCSRTCPRRGRPRAAMHSVGGLTMTRRQSSGVPSRSIPTTPPRGIGTLSCCATPVGTTSRWSRLSEPSPSIQCPQPCAFCSATFSTIRAGFGTRRTPTAKP